MQNMDEEKISDEELVNSISYPLLHPEEFEEDMEK